MATFTCLEETEVRSLLRDYPVSEMRAFKGIPAGSVNSNFAIELADARFFLRVYEEQDADGARAEAKLLAYLASRGVPTAAPIARRDGSLLSKARGKPAALFAWMPGAMRCQAGVSVGDAEQVGAALGRVHVAGADAERGAGRFREADLFGRLDRIAASAAPALAAEAAPLREALRTWSSQRDGTLPRGLVHGDLFRDNVLWGEDGRISALLDFESASDGVLAYDLMVTVLAWCVGDTLDTRLFRALVAGYESVRPLRAIEKDALCTEGCLAALRFTVTRITDYAMRGEVGLRVIKDWRRFYFRFAMLRDLGPGGIARALQE